MSKTLGIAAPFLPGQVVAGRYRVLDVVGGGAMGTVLRATDHALDGDIVALKVLHPHVLADQQALTRFQNEVLICRQLSHPHIVRMYDFEIVPEADLAFLTMECIPGPNLREYLLVHKGKRLVLEDGVRVFHHMARALSFAHEKKVLHRDVKPENILLSRAGEAKLGDFGLASCLETTLKLTRTGETVGTPLYMAPEVLSGEKATAQSDMYSLGIVAYEMFAGAPPFDDENTFTVARRHVTEELPLEPLQEAGLPFWLIDCIQRCTAKCPADRFKSCSDLAQCLNNRADYLREEPRLTLTAHHRLYEDKHLLPERIRRVLRAAIPALLCLLTAAAILPQSSTMAKKTLLRNLFAVELDLNIDLSFLKTLFLLPGYSPHKPCEVLTAAKKGESIGIYAFQENGIGLDCRDEQGNNLYHLGVLLARSDNGACLIKRPNLLSERNNDGYTPLHLAVLRSDRANIDCLLAKDPGHDLRDPQGNTALQLALLVRDIAAVDHILRGRGGACLGCWKRNAAGKTALHIAVETGEAILVDYLLQQGADPNVTDETGRTPLMLALTLPRDRAQIIAPALLRYGASRSARDASCRPVDEYARERGALDLLVAAQSQDSTGLSGG